MTRSTGTEDIVYAVATSPNFIRDGVCFAARQSGLYRSDDGGRTWRSTYANLKLEGPLATSAVALSPDFETDHGVFAGVQGGLLISADGGGNWQAVVLPSPPPNLSAVCVSPDYSSDGTLFAATLDDGIYRSSDRGRHWTSSNFGLLDLNVLCASLSADFARDETLAIGTESGIFQSTNGGRSWREVDFPVEWAPVLCLAYSPNFAADGLMLAGTEACGLFRSTDRARSWTRLGHDEMTEAINGIVPAVGSSGELELLVALPDALLISHNEGQSWSPWKDDFRPSAALTTLVAPQGLGPDGLALVGLADGRVLRLQPTEAGRGSA